MLRLGLRRKAPKPWPAFPSLQQLRPASLSSWHSLGSYGPFEPVHQDMTQMEPKKKALERGLNVKTDFEKVHLKRGPGESSWEPVPGLRIWIAKRHSVPPRSGGFMEWPGHVLLDKILDVLAEKSRKVPLWIMAEANSQRDLKTTGVVRVTQERRLRFALLRALHLHGYDKQGRKLKPSSSRAGSASAPTPQPSYARGDDPDELYGMVKLSCTAVEIADFPRDKMVAHFVKLVQELKKQLGSRAEKRPKTAGDQNRHRPNSWGGNKPATKSRDSRPQERPAEKPRRQQDPKATSRGKESRGKKAPSRAAEGDDEWVQLVAKRR